MVYKPAHLLSPPFQKKFVSTLYSDTGLRLHTREAETGGSWVPDYRGLYSKTLSQRNKE